MTRLRGTKKKEIPGDPLVQSSSTLLPTPTTWTTTLVADGHGTLWHPHHHPHDDDDDKENSPTSPTIASIHLDHSEDEDAQVRICFRNHTLRNLLLCWVSHDGSFHHYYTLPPFSPLQTKEGNNQRPEGDGNIMVTTTDDDHIETSTVGHAFVVLATTGTATKEEHDQLLLQIQQEESIAPFASRVRIVGAYRSNHRPHDNDDDDEEEEVIHLVEVIDPSLDNDNRSELLQHPVRSTRSFFLSSIWRRQLQSRIFSCCCGGFGRHPKIKKYKDENDKGRDDDEEEDEKGLEEDIEEAVPLPTTATVTSTVPHDSTRYTLTARLVRLGRGADDLCVCDTSQKYYQRQYFGKCRWPVMVEPKWYGNDRTLETLLAHDLDCMVACLPEHAVTLLRDTSPTPIYINRTLQYGRKRRPITGRGMCFHPGSEWLQRNGMSVKKCESVEMYRASEYREMCQDWGQGGILLHEFSHAYHHKGCVDGYDNEEIMECYQEAMSEGIYDSVPVHGPQGPVAPAYAKTNAMEYFAELSTAFLGGIPSLFQNDDDDKNDIETGAKNHRRKQVRTGGKTTNVVQPNHHSRDEYNKWYPHNRQQLLDHDPRAYALLQKIWKIP